MAFANPQPRLDAGVCAAVLGHGDTALEARLTSLSAYERQRRRHALFRALEPGMMTPATEGRHDFRELFTDPAAVGARLDELVAGDWNWMGDGWART